MRSRNALTAPLVCLCHVDHPGMRQLDGGCVQLDFCVVSEHRPDLTLRGCSVRRIMSYRTHQSLSPPRYIPSPTHYAGFGTRVSAGFFSPTDGVAGAASSGCLMGRGCAPFTCGTWCLWSGVWNGRWHGCLTACERVYGSLCTCAGSPLTARELEGSMALNLVGGNSRHHLDLQRNQSS